MKEITIEEFFFDVSLYKNIYIEKEIDEDDKKEIKPPKSISVRMEYSTLVSILNFTSINSIEGYNAIEKCETTFTGDRRYIDPTRHPDDICVEIKILCRRHGTVYKYFLQIYDIDSGYVVQKIGQHPSLADLHLAKIKQYDKLLKDEATEFTKAIGLYAHGIGIGSFVYLRRIFENLIWNTAKEHKTDNEYQEFMTLRMDEKIEDLKGHLPSFLVENKDIYVILSKGIHELTEEECLGYFDAVKTSIEFILDQKLEQEKNKKKKEEAQARIKAIKSRL